MYNSKINSLPHSFTNVVNVSFVCLQVDPNDQRDHIEQSPDSGVLVQQLATRIASDGGFALIADYGHTGDKTDTFRVSHNEYVFTNISARTTFE